MVNKPKNPYLTISGCVERLYKEYQEHPKLLVAIDFDNSIGDRFGGQFDYSDTINVLKRCQKRGFYLTIFTAAGPERWNEMLAHFKELGVEVHAVNDNPIRLPYGIHGKIYYNILLDDRAGLGAAIEILNKLLDKIELKEFYKNAERSNNR